MSTKIEVNPEHARKYNDFLRMIEEAKAGKLDRVVIAAPWAIGDNYGELTTNLGLLAEAGVTLAIAQPS